MEDIPKYETDVAKFDERHKPESILVPVDNSLTSVMQLAIQKNYTPEFIEKMMELSERHEANEAKRAYHKAMARFKANPPKIWRDMQIKYKVGDKVTEWSSADLATAAEAINRSLGENGLNSTWRTLPINDNKIRVTCIIAHELGHSEETYLESGPDTTGSKNAIQAIGSAVFYLERYTLFALTGLAPARMDDDGQKADIQYINTDMVIEINDLIKSTKADKSKVLKYLKAKSVDKILLSDYGKALVAFKAKEAAIPEPGNAG